MSAQTNQPRNDSVYVEKIEEVLSASVQVGVAIAAVRAILAPLHLPGKAIEAAVKIALSQPIGTGTITAMLRYRVKHPNGSLGRPLGAVKKLIRVPKAPEGVKSAAQTAREVERTYRAAYLLNAARRLARALREGEFPQAVQKERNYWVRHLDAQDRRAVAAGRVDNAAAAFGPLLGWYARNDERTTAECRAANGNNFRVDVRPTIGYPGTVHPYCRCEPGAPHEGGKMVDRATRGVPGAEARPTLRRRSA